MLLYNVLRTDHASLLSRLTRCPLCYVVLYVAFCLTMQRIHAYCKRDNYQLYIFLSTVLLLFL